MNILGGNACASHKLLCQTASINLGWKSLENKALLLVFFFLLSNQRRNISFYPNIQSGHNLIIK